MKFFWTILTLIGFGTPFLVAQTSLSGSIQATTAKTAVLYFDPTTLGEESSTLETVIDENGQFQFDINLPIGIPAVLQVANFNCLLFLFPDKSLQIELQLKGQHSPLIIFDEVGAEDNQFYSQYQVEFNQEKKNIPSKLLDKFKPKDYLVYQTKLRERKLNYLYKNQSKIDERLFNWLENDIHYEFANDLMEYPDLELITQKPPKKYYHFLKTIKLNNEEAILQASYQRFLLEYTKYQLFKPQKWGRFVDTNKQFDFVRRYFFGDALYYLQFFILKTSLKFDEDRVINSAYQEFMASNAPEGFKRQLRQTHQLASRNILGQSFPTYMIRNQYGTSGRLRLKAENAKLFYIWQTPIETEKIRTIQALYKKIASKKYLDFGLIGLDKSIEFPKALSDIPQFWVPSYSLIWYYKEIPIKEKEYLVFVNKYGEIIDYITWELEVESVNEIADFMEENYKSRVYPTLSNRLFRQKTKEAEK